MLFVRQPLQLLSFNSSLLRIQILTFMPGRNAATKPCQIHVKILYPVYVEII